MLDEELDAVLGAGDLLVSDEPPLDVLSLDDEPFDDSEDDEPLDFFDCERLSVL